MSSWLDIRPYMDSAPYRLVDFLFFTFTLFLFLIFPYFYPSF